MFIIDIHYTAPLDEVDQYIDGHVAYLKKYSENNTFIISGRKVPRTGGIILAVGKSREEIEEIMQEDPFCTHGLAEVTVTEFLTSQTHPEFKKLLKTVFGV